MALKRPAKWLLALLALLAPVLGVTLRWHTAMAAYVQTILANGLDVWVTQSTAAGTLTITNGGTSTFTIKAAGITPTVSTVAKIGTCGTADVGTIAVATDNKADFGATVSTTGTNSAGSVLALCNGTNWIVR